MWNSFSWVIPAEQNNIAKATQKCLWCIWSLSLMVLRSRNCGAQTLKVQYTAKKMTTIFKAFLWTCVCGALCRKLKGFFWRALDPYTRKFLKCSAALLMDLPELRLLWWSGTVTEVDCANMRHFFFEAYCIWITFMSGLVNWANFEQASWG